MKKEYTVDSSNTLKQILEGVKAFVYKFTCDENTHVVSVDYITENVEDIFNISEKEFIQRVKRGKLNELFTEKTNEKNEAVYVQSIQNEQKTSIRHQLHNGEWIQEKIHPEKTEDKLISVFGIVQNITQEVREEETKKLAERKYEELFNRNLAGVFRTHVNGTIQACNQAFCEILGYSDFEELSKVSLNDIYYYKGDRDSYIALLREKKFLTKQLAILKRRDGRKIIVNNNVGIYPDEKGKLNIIEGTLVDVTQEYETNISLQQNERKYKLIFDSSNISILLLSYLEGELFILQGNSHASKLLKAKRREDIKGLSLNQFFTKPVSFAKTLKALKDYDKIQEEREIVDLQGNNLNVELFFSYVLIENEQIIQLVIQDNTAKKKNRQDLENSQRNFKNIVDTSPAGIFIFSEEELMYCNAIAQEILAIKRKTKATKLRDIFSNKQYNVFKHLSENEDNQPYVEIDIENTFRYSVKLVSITYNNKPAVLISLTDVTLQYQFNTQKLRAEIAEETNYELEKEIEQHKRTQEQLLEKSSRLRAFIESSANLFIGTLNKDFLLTSMNKNFEKEFRKHATYHVNIGTKLMEVIGASPRGRRWFENKLRRTFEGRDQVIITKFPSVQGRELWLEIFLNPIYIGEATPVEISMVAHDITEKIENERKIIASESNNKALVQAIPDLIYRITKEGNFTDFKINNKLDSDLFFSYTSTRNIVGKNIYDVFIDDIHSDSVMEYVDKALESDKLVTHLYRVKNNAAKKGGFWYYENRYSKISDNEVLIIARNITEQEENEIQLKESLKEKEILLKEVHHRVKNNLQVINSILNLQKGHFEEPGILEFINESQNRIRSMSYIHESLYLTENFSSINFHNYITNLVSNLFHSYQTHGERIKLNLDVQNCNLLLDQAIPCGLILNELLSNALKYAFPDNREGEITVQLKEEEGIIHLEVRDDGVGLGKDFDIQNLDSLGLSLVDVLVDQLDGNLEYGAKTGTRFLIIFEKAEA